MPTFTKTKSFSADSVQRMGLEAAWVNGPLSLQGEYLAAVCDTPSAGHPYLPGLYVQTSYLLTGESRPYDRKTGVFKGIQPRRDFGENGSWGAWEITGRYSYLDLDQGQLSVTARRLNDITLGLNWYLNPNVRVMWNYVHSWANAPGIDSAADILMVRFQIAF